MGYKKLTGIEWSDKERRLIDELDDNSPFLDVNLSLAPFVVKMLKSPLLPEHMPVLKLSLSGIANMMNKSQYASVLPSLGSTNNHKEKLDEIATCFCSRDLESATLDVLRDLRNQLNKSDDVDDLLALICDLKKPFLRSKARSQQAYRALRIIECLMEQAGGVTLEESEATTSRRVANIMEELFRWTAVKLVDGEHTSDSTRSIRQYNDIVYGMNSGAIVMGRRVDMLVQSGKREVELSSMEIKKPITPPSLIVDQQCKNLRTNGAILSQLQRIGLNRQFDRVVAMDWVGTVGYLYLLVDINNVYFAYQIGVLILPKSCAELRNFDKTLKLLFAYQNAILRLAVDAQAAVETRQNLDQVCEVIDITGETDPLSSHNIFITPHTHK